MSTLNRASSNADLSFAFCQFPTGLPAEEFLNFREIYLSNEPDRGGVQEWQGVAVLKEQPNFYLAIGCVILYTRDRLQASLYGHL